MGWKRVNRVSVATVVPMTLPIAAFMDVNSMVSIIKLRLWYRKMSPARVTREKVVYLPQPRTESVPSSFPHVEIEALPR